MNQPVVRIAVSGHRQLADLQSVAQGITAAAGRILKRFPSRRFHVYSCLAEGSDQLLAGGLVDALGAGLIVVLPLQEAEYVKDFPTARSLEAFSRLKKLALEVVNLRGALIRPGAYQAANEYLIEHCDVLVVIWDGLPARGEGGTGDMVAMARQAGRALLWIHSSPHLDAGAVTEERFAGENGL